MSNLINDSKARGLAIDVKDSYIVQAPAGSGKTELLTQRVLNLLSAVNQPEEIVAITFTNKAAQEMLQRIIESLQSVAQPMPEEAHKQLTWRLAKKALQRDKELNWGLLHSPHRLRIMAFDALTSLITRQMPVLSRFGSQVSPSDFPEHLYQAAAQETLEGLKNNDSWADSIEVLLDRTDNQFEKLKNLLANQLPKRDQWQRLVASGLAQRETLEQGFKEAFTLKLRTFDELLPADIKEQLLSVILFAASYARELKEEKPYYSNLRGLTAWPESTVEELDAWRAIAELCLVKDGKKFRAGADLPAQKHGEDKAQKAEIKAMKAQSKAVFELITELPNHDEIVQQLKQIKFLPDAHYSDEQWQSIESLLELMAVASAHLTLEFKQSGTVDFNEISLAADRALGELDEPSNLALKLDYSMSHILVDEFQDTSFGQWSLLQKLTAGWQPNDGKTLFIVGDPMQSIYRFREANVGLFIQARDHGLGDIALNSLKLTSNFRSSAAIVNWVNQSFEAIFPQRDSSVLGAVSLAHADATKSKEGNEGENEGVVLKAFAGSSLNQEASDAFSESLAHGLETAESEEAAYIAQSVSENLAQFPEDSIAILVRSKNHANAIMDTLRASKIPFKAESMEKLSEQQIVIDLMTLCRILLQPMDHIAWLGLLKSPWFGLSLEDMTTLKHHYGDKLFAMVGDFTVSLETSELQSPEITLSTEAAHILQRQLPVIARAIAQFSRGSMSILIEKLWLQLGGVQTNQDDAQLEYAYAFFELLSSLETQQVVTDIAVIDKSIDKLFSEPSSAPDCRVSIMTMHSSKGLEFDTVYLPQLHKQPRNDDRALMVWEEFPVENKAQIGSQYLIAPIAEVNSGTSLYKVISDFSREKNRLESARLLYVAATRAKKRLYLTAQIKYSEDKKAETVSASLKYQQANKQSLFSFLEPQYLTYLESEICRVDASVLENKSAASSRNKVVADWYRLKQGWEQNELSNPFTKDELVQLSINSNLVSLDELEVELDEDTISKEDERLELSVEYDWATDIAIEMGNKIHRQLELIGRGLWTITSESLETMLQRYKQELHAQGFAEKAIAYALKHTRTALENVATDDNAQWILERHPIQGCEVGLTGHIDGEFKSFVLDRTFVAEGVRWIIDYKTGVHLGDDSSGFIANQISRYRPQLEQYKRLMQAIETRPVKIALYFPMNKHLAEL